MVKQVPVLGEEVRRQRLLVVRPEHHRHARIGIEQLEHMVDGRVLDDDIRVDEQEDRSARLLGAGVARGGRTAAANVRDHTDAVRLGNLPRGVSGPIVDDENLDEVARAARERPQTRMPIGLG